MRILPFLAFSALVAGCESTPERTVSVDPAGTPPGTPVDDDFAAHVEERPGGRSFFDGIIDASERE